MPRKTALGVETAVSLARFNEAGAKCPGKLVSVPPVEPVEPGFNEAGAKCPGKLRIGV